MKIKTAELDGVALDWAVTSIEEPDALRWGWDSWRDARRNSPVNGYYPYRYHQNWNQGGPIIDRERISIDQHREIVASIWQDSDVYGLDHRYQFKQRGPTPLVAAMRCYVASKLGDEVDVPEELL